MRGHLPQTTKHTKNKVCVIMHVLISLHEGNDGCNGGLPGQAMKESARQGFALESCFPVSNRPVNVYKQCMFVYI